MALSNLASSNKADIITISEVEYKPEHAPFALDGYTVFLPLVEQGAKTRVLVLVRSTLAVEANATLRTDLMTTSGNTVWVELGPHVRRAGGRTALHGGLLFAGVYRQWEDTLETERIRLLELTEQMERAASLRPTVVMGDFNADNHRLTDSSYYRRAIANELAAATERAGYEYKATDWTWQSYGAFGADSMATQRKSCLDHVYVAGITATVALLDDATTDHRPMVANVSAGSVCNNTAKYKVIKRRNVKRLTQTVLETELSTTVDWSLIHRIKTAEGVYAFVVAGINATLDKVAPYEVIKVRQASSDLYLKQATLNCIRMRDRARASKDPRFKDLRNRATVLIAKDKRDSNMAKLDRSLNEPKLLWQIANAALGKNRPSLPAAIRKEDGSMSSGDYEAANVLNRAYMSKVKGLRDCTLGAPPATSDKWPHTSLPFSWSFASAGKIVKTIRGLKNTGALGMDNIPVAVLKLGVEVLAAPIAHLCNVSFATGVMPAGLKVGRVTPVYKGNGKDRMDPASYRPVSILSPLSKVIEILAKSDLGTHLEKTNGLPANQFGFRSRRGCTTAIGVAHAGWLKAARGSVVGVLGFDLTCAFDTVDAGLLLPKLERLGIRGRELSWVASYLADGKQCVVWNEATSDLVDVALGVRQGSILGPLLFIILVADLPAYLGSEEDNVLYADDVNTWDSAPTVEELATKLTAKARLIVDYARGNGLTLNAAKTQLMYSRKAGPRGVPIVVDGAVINPGDHIELLGVKFDRNLSTATHDANVAAAARQKASLVARLGHHVPKGRYLRTLATGLFAGKVSHALAAVAMPRLSAEDKENTRYKLVQTAQNDVARTVTGHTRSEHVTVPVLLQEAHLQSINAMVVSAVALEAWTSFHSSDGVDGGRNPLGIAIFGNDNGRTTRASEKGHTHIELRGENTLASNAGKIWNASPALRLALTRGEAKAAARLLALSAPL